VGEVRKRKVDHREDEKREREREREKREKWLGLFRVQLKSWSLLRFSIHPQLENLNIDFGVWLLLCFPLLHRQPLLCRILCGEWKRHRETRRASPGRSQLDRYDRQGKSFVYSILPRHRERATAGLWERFVGHCRVVRELRQQFPTETSESETDLKRFSRIHSISLDPFLSARGLPLRDSPRTNSFELMLSFDARDGVELVRKARALQEKFNSSRFPPPSNRLPAYTAEGSRIKQAHVGSSLTWSNISAWIYKMGRGNSELTERIECFSPEQSRPQRVVNGVPGVIGPALQMSSSACTTSPRRVHENFHRFVTRVFQSEESTRDPET
jgi:hypothetical protein